METQTKTMTANCQNVNLNGSVMVAESRRFFRRFSLECEFPKFLKVFSISTASNGSLIHQKHDRKTTLHRELYQMEIRTKL